MQTSIVSVNLNLVSKVDSSVSAHVQAIPSKYYSDNGPEIWYIHCRVAFWDPKVFSTCYMRTTCIVTKNIVFHVDALMS